MVDRIETVLRKMAAVAIDVNGKCMNSYVHKVLKYENLVTAYEQVAKNLRRNTRKRFKRKKLICPDDTVDVKAFDKYLIDNGEKIAQEILSGVYLPKPAYRVLIPKKDGGTRQLGVFTPPDRFIQQAILCVLREKYENSFSEKSHGFIKRRGVLSAAMQGKSFLDEGYIYAISLDVFKCFDKIEHIKMIEILMRDIKDGRFLILVRRFIKDDVIFKNRRLEICEGVPQGGPISPICANIYLNELDKFLDEKGYKYVRYADDITIFIKSKNMSHEIIEEIDDFLKKMLRLKLNRDKTKICSAERVDLLGFGYRKNTENDTYELCISDDKVTAILQKVNEFLKDSTVEWQEIKDVINCYSHNFTHSICTGTQEYKYAVIDRHLISRLNNFIWRKWEYKGCKEKKSLNLGLDSSEREWVINIPVSNWGKKQYDISKKYLNKEFLEKDGVVFFDDSHKDALKRRAIKAALEEDILT